SNSNTASVLLGNGNGTFRGQSTVATGTRPSVLAITDLNGDSKLDLVIANQGGNSVGVLQGIFTGFSGTSNAVTVSAGAAAKFTVVAAPTSVTAGSTVSVTATAFDAFNNLASNYVGPVHFS